ncbi:MAG: GIY-YIG nuclease family protein, partial [Acidobacteriota bacterium]
MAPGVYLFKNEKGQAIYVGKAKRLRDRVRSHLSAGGDQPKRTYMLEEAVEVDVIVTDTELEALALENSLIKQNRPKYNVLLRDDKNYPYLRLTISERFPRLQYVRKVKGDGDRYFGPYAPATTAHHTQLLIYRHFGVRPCNIDIDGSWDRPCLYYEIGEC